MGCRVGMTTDLKERKEYWEGQYPSLSNWQVHAKGLSYNDAQDLENKLAAEGNCDSQAGGGFVSGNVWAVYSFDF